MSRLADHLAMLALIATPCLGQATKRPAVALAIGVTEVDPRAYQTKARMLVAALDARAILQRLGAAGIPSHTKDALIGSRATRKAVTENIRAARHRLQPDGLFILYYSGHGGLVPDLNNDETDSEEDSTWCLFDGQMVDDEIGALLAEFPANTRILVISDSCYSGSITKSIANATWLSTDKRSELQEQSTRSLSFAQIEREVMERTASQVEVSHTESEIASLRAYQDRLRTLLPLAHDAERDLAILDSVYGKDKVRPKNLPSTVSRAEFTANIERYRAIPAIVKPPKAAEASPAILTLSACEASQVAWPGSVLSVFTHALLDTVDSPSTDTYVQLHKSVLAKIHYVQQPVLSLHGAKAEAFSLQRPLLTQPLTDK